MMLPKVTEDCSKAIFGKSKSDVFLYGAEFMVRLLVQDRKDLVGMIRESVELMFPKDLTEQAKAATSITLILSAMNATMEAEELKNKID